MPCCELLSSDPPAAAPPPVPLLPLACLPVSRCFFLHIYGIASPRCGVYLGSARAFAEDYKGELGSGRQESRVENLSRNARCVCACVRACVRVCVRACMRVRVAVQGPGSFVPVCCSCLSFFACLFFLVLLSPSAYRPPFSTHRHVRQTPNHVPSTFSRRPPHNPRHARCA